MTAKYDELAPFLFVVASAMDLPADWLDNAVGMFTPLHETILFSSLPASTRKSGRACVFYWRARTISWR